MRELVPSYEIMTAPSPETLEARINDSLEAGYTLQGGVCVVYRPDNPDAPYVYYQALIGKR
ncbi:DUF1737 domain-containing protein [Histidinibacterium lentulum]|uniref:DUF1737 domain-containing protein n=1 Tax=Histidinibacterium lentulum TaxID=2480588 RepID=A0A3N2R7U2_9RHOB|nr:DUF1737 domain-containing protein [Histidinibacterium lentulum]